MRFTRAVVVATVALVIWGMLFWAVLYEPLGLYHALPDPAAVIGAVGDAPTGTYFLPWPRDTPAAFDAFVAQHQQGPFFRLQWVREGVDPNSPMKIAVGTAHHAAVALIAALLLKLSGTRERARRFGIVMLGGALGTVYVTIGDPIWFHVPWDLIRGLVVYEVGGWLTLATTLAWLLDPPTTRLSTSV